MKVRRLSIKMTDDDKSVLEKFYLARGFAVDHYDSHPAYLHELTDAFNAMTGRNESPGDILHFMRTKRKRGDWPKLGNQAKKPDDSPRDEVPSDLMPALEAAYLQIARELDIGNDSIAYEPELGARLECLFSEKTGQHIAAPALIDALLSTRKRGNLDRLGTTPPDRSFADFDKASNM